MNKIRIATVTLWIVTALVLFGLALWFVLGSGIFGEGRINLNHGFPNFGSYIINSLTGPYEVRGEYSQSSSGINNIDISWVAGDVTVRTHDGDDIKITESAQRELNDGENLQITVDGNTLSINFTTANQRRMPPKKLEVLVPSMLGENLKILIIDTASGGIDVEGINTEEFTADSTSGSIRVWNVTANTLYVESSSGTIGGSNITAQAVNFSTTSGSIITDNINVGSISMSSTSGDCRITGSFSENLNSSTSSGDIYMSGEYVSVNASSTSGDIEITNSATGTAVNASSSSGTISVSGDILDAELDSTSGSIFLKSTIIPSSLKAGSTSGDITITVPGGREVSVRHSTTSGRFSSEIPVVITDSVRDAVFNLSATSGDIRILAS